MKLSDLGYLVSSKENDFITAKKRDILDLCDIMLVFDTKTKRIGYGLITLSPIKTLGDVSHMYSCYREMIKDVDILSKEIGYEKYKEEFN